LSDSGKSISYRAALLLDKGKTIPQSLALRLLQEARRGGFRLELVTISEEDPPRQVTLLLPLITANHSVTISIQSKKANSKEDLERLLSNGNFDIIYAEKNFIENLGEILTKTAIKVIPYNGEVAEKDA